MNWKYDVYPCRRMCAFIARWESIGNREHGPEKSLLPTHTAADLLHYLPSPIGAFVHDIADEDGRNRHEQRQEADY